MLQEKNIARATNCFYVLMSRTHQSGHNPVDVVHDKPYRIWYGITNIWVLNSKGEILCTRRASHVEGSPSKWQTYLGGHVKAGSTFSETALSELAEEIDVKVTKDDLKLVENGRREDTMHMYESYSVLFDEDLSKLNFSDSEVSEAKWLSFAQYKNSRKKTPNNWCNGITPEQYQKALEILNISIPAGMLCL